MSGLNEDEFGDLNEEMAQVDADEDIEEADIDIDIEEEEEVVEKPRRGRKSQEESGKTPKAPKEPKAPKAPKAAKVVPTLAEKTIQKMLKKAGVQALPPLSQIVAGKVGPSVKIKDIGIFIGDPEDALLLELFNQCPVKNNINLSAEVCLDQVLRVGAQIIESGRMFQPISVAKIGDNLECTSGRHRLAFLGLAYGAEAEVPVYAEEMDINTARDAVVVSNQSRKTRAMELVEHAVLAAVGGKADASQDEVYSKMVKSKKSARKYCVFSVVSRKVPCRLEFPISMSASRKAGALTTVKNLDNFWSQALAWEPGMSAQDFDQSLKESTEFLNALVAKMRGVEGFNAEHHLASMTLSGIGKYYRGFQTVSGNPISCVDKIAEAVVGMGEIGRQKSDKTFQAIGKAIKPK